MTPEQERLYEGLLKRIIEKPEILDELLDRLQHDEIVDEQGEKK